MLWEELPELGVGFQSQFPGRLSPEWAGKRLNWGLESTGQEILGGFQGKCWEMLLMRRGKSSSPPNRDISSGQENTNLPFSIKTTLVWRGRISSPSWNGFWRFLGNSRQSQELQLPTSLSTGDAEPRVAALGWNFWDETFPGTKTPLALFPLSLQSHRINKSAITWIQTPEVTLAVEAQQNQCGAEASLSSIDSPARRFFPLEVAESKPKAAFVFLIKTPALSGFTRQSQCTDEFPFN